MEDGHGIRGWVVGVGVMEFEGTGGRLVAGGAREGIVARTQ